MSFKLFPQVTDCFLPITEDEQLLVNKMKKNEVDPRKLLELKLRVFLYLGGSSVLFGLLGNWTFSSLLKDVEKAALKKTEEVCSQIEDKVKRADVLYQRNLKVGTDLLRFGRYRKLAITVFTLMGISYGLSQVRYYTLNNAKSYL